MNADDLKVKLFADGADAAVIAELARDKHIQGFTTNPTLMRKAGITDYRAFALEVLEIVPDRPVSFEVFSDEFDEMERQAHEIASWGANVFVKIPVTNTRGEFCGSLVRRLAASGVQVNVTAILTLHQVQRVAACLSPYSASYVSVFAGRIADTGRDPLPIMRESVRILTTLPQTELIWASPRELFNVVQADDVGCHIITATSDVLKKLSLLGKDLDGYSLETVEMFYRDATAAGYQIETKSAERRLVA
jgi:transaldolase